MAGKEHIGQVFLFCCQLTSTTVKGQARMRWRAKGLQMVIGDLPKI